LTHASPPERSAGSERRSRHLAFAGVAIASFLGCIDFTIVNTAIAAIQKDFGASVGQSQWIITAFVMALSAFMVAAGRAADLHGRRIVLHAGMLAFGAASLGAALSPGLGWLVGWRTLQGLSCAVLYTASTAIVAHAFPEAERGKAIGLLFGINGVGLAIGPVLGSLLVATWGWRSVFMLNVPLILLGFALCLGHVQESRSAGPGERLDFAGLVLLLVALPCLLLLVGFGAEWGWLSARSLGTAAIGLLLLVALWQVERRVPSPLLRLDLLGNRQFLVASLASASLAFFYCSAFFLMPLYLAHVRGEASAQIGLALLPTTATMALVSPWAGRLADRRGTALPLMGGFGFLALSAALQASLGASSGLVPMLAAFVCMGIGWGCILGPSTVAALAALPPALSGVATGACWTLHNFGGALGLAITTAVYNARATPHGPAAESLASPTEFLAGYQAAMVLLVAVSTLALLMTALTRKGDGTPQTNNRSTA